MPWILAGDFNTFLPFDEKIGHKNLHMEPCTVFMTCVLSYRLEDIPYSGSFHT